MGGLLMASEGATMAARLDASSPGYHQNKSMPFKLLKSARFVIEPTLSRRIHRDTMFSLTYHYVFY